MKKIGLVVIGILLLLLAGGIAFAASQYNIGMGTHVVSSGGNQRASANYQVNDVLGEAIVGTSTSANGILRSGYPLPIVPLNPWVSRYNGPTSNDDMARAIAVDGSGNVYVTGQSSGIGMCTDYVTIKYDSAGYQLWAARYNNEQANGDDSAYGIAVDSLGNVYVTGESDNGSTSWDYATIKYDSNGDQVWVARYNGPASGSDGGLYVAVDGSGNVYVTGFSDGIGTGCDYATIKYDSNGNQVWVARYNGPANGRDCPAAITSQWGLLALGCGLAVDNLGNVYVTGTSEGSGTGYDYASIKYNTVGTQVWVARYNGTANGNDGGMSIAVDGSSSVYVTGYSQGSGSGYDYLTIKYNSVGSQVWSANYSAVANMDDMAIGMAVDGAGNVYVTGTSQTSGTGYDYATMKYNSLGHRLWVARYNGPANMDDTAFGIAVDSLGNVYVTGDSDNGSTSYDCVTIKYDSAGKRLWSSSYNGPSNGNDEGFDISVDNWGSVYVTGFSEGSGTGYDYLTIKYMGDNTPFGLKVTVAATDPQTGQLTPATLTFDEVTTPGQTTAVITGQNPGGPIPLDLHVLNNQFLDITTTAQPSGEITVCINYDESQVVDEQDLLLSHWNGSKWEDVTTYVDPVNNVVCGNVTALSPFFIGERNHPPVVNAGGDAAINEGSTFARSGYFTDPDSSSWTAKVDYGDGSSVQSLALAGNNFDLSNTYADDGTYICTITIADDDGGIGTATIPITVLNVAPTVEAGPGQIVEVFNPISFAGNFTDPGWLDTHTAKWDWGDGTTSDGTVTEIDGAGNVTGSHTYSLVGNYTITLKVTDDDGGVGADTLNVEVIQKYAAWGNANDAKAILWSGSGEKVKGNVHSNGGITMSGSNNAIDGTVYYTSKLAISGSKDTFTSSQRVSPRPMPVHYNLSNYQLGAADNEAKRAQNAGKYHLVTGNFNVSTSGTVLDGLYYVKGNVALSGSNMKGTFTIVAEGTISISGSGMNCTPYSSGLLFFSNGTSLAMSGSNSSLGGIIYVPKGQIAISGSGNKISGGLFGDKVTLSGSNMVIIAK